MNVNPLDLAEFQEQIGHHFKDQSLLRQVFVHRSYLNEHRDFQLGHNERLEFLGDAVLELVVTEYLYRHFPNPEGELTNWRSALVKGETLGQVAKELGFSQYLLLSHGETKSGGKSNSLLLANAFEALLGALYLDAGYASCQEFLEKQVLTRLREILEQGLFIDPKSRLQEYTQEHLAATPLYQVTSSEGPDHAKQFEVAVFVGEKELARGNGSSKQAAQVAAAEAALAEIINTNR